MCPVVCRAVCDYRNPRLVSADSAFILITGSRSNQNDMIILMYIFLFIYNSLFWYLLVVFFLLIYANSIDIMENFA